MCLGRHGQLLSLILVTFHMFDSVFNHIFLFVYSMLWISIIWKSSLAAPLVLIKLRTVHLPNPDGAFRPQRPLLCLLARVGLSAFVVFCFEELGIERHNREGLTHLLVVCLKISMSLFFWCLSLCLLLSVSLSLCCHLSFRMKGLGIVQRFTVFSSLKWHLL